MIRRFLAFASFVLAGSIPTTDLAAQAANSLDAREFEALQLKSAARYRESYDKIAQLLATRAEESQLTPASSARIEFLLELLDNLAHKIPDHAGVVATLDNLTTRASVQRDAIVSGLAHHIAASHLMLAGRVRDASKRMDQLGYVRRFAVLGPLDNERGSGFRQAFAPETAPEQAYDMSRPIDGKKRPVNWRSVQIDDVALADLDLGARLRPSTQCLAYVAFTISSENDRDLCLRFGSTGSIVAFVRGHEVYRRDIQSRPLGFDQGVCTFRARTGKTLVLLKVCTQERDFAVRVRVTTPDGKPVDATSVVDASLDVLQSEFANKDANKSSSKSEISPAIGATEFLTKRIARLREQNPKPDSEAGRTLGLEAFRLAYIFGLRAPDDEANRRDREYAKLATQMAPRFGIAHFVRAFTLIRRGASNPDRDENARRQALEDAIRAWPRSAEAMRALASLERETLETHTVAEEWLRRALAVNPQYVYACAEHLEVLEDQDLDETKRRRLAEYLAIPDVGGHPTVLDHAIDEADRRNDLSERITLLTAKLTAEYDESALLELARSHMQAGDRASAKARFEEARDTFPQSRRAHAQLARHHTSRGQLDAALDTWGRWLQVCPEDSSTHLALADIYQQQGNTALEATELRTALELNPNLKTRRRRLDWLETDTKAFYDDYKISTEQAKSNDKGPPSDSKQAGDTHYYVFRHRVVRAYRNGTASRYEHFLVKILGEEGLNVFDVYRARYGRGNPSVRILEAKVTRPDGSVQRGRIGYSSYVDLPPIQVGDWVEIAARIDDRSRTFFGDYFGYTHLFPANEPVPVRESRLDLILEPGRQYSTQRLGRVPGPKTAKLEDGSQHLQWIVRDLPRRRTETLAPSILERGPLVRVSTYKTWDAFASWWWNLIRKQTVATPEIKSKVRDLTEGATTLDEKIRRIYEFVVDEISYQAWEFGVHGYKPYSVGSIFARRFGDCKDKSILMNAMFAEIGVEAYPVLIHAERRRDRDDLTLPMVEHFNHCISYVPAQKGLPARFLDGTATYHPVNDIPEMDRGAKVLVVRGEKGELLDVPWTTSENNRDITKYVVNLGADGSAEIEYERRPGSSRSPSVRDLYGNKIGTRNERLGDQLGKLFSGAKLERAEFSELDKMDIPVFVRASLTVPSFAQKSDGGMRLKTAFRKQNLSRLAASESRTFDLVLSTPASSVTEIEYVLPPGHEFSGLPENIKFESPVGRASLTITRKERSVVVRSELAIHVARIPKDQYGSFREMTETLDRIESLEFRMEKSR